jgi:hypothetical protein
VALEGEPLLPMMRPVTGQVLKYDGMEWAPAADLNTGGTVTQIATGAGLTGGPITGSGTIAIASGGVSNAMLASPSVTVSAGAGLSGGGAVALGGSVTLTNAGVNTLTANAPLAISGTVQNPVVSLTGALGGDVGGAYGNTTVVAMQKEPISSTAPAAGQVLQYSGTQWAPTTQPSPFPTGAVMFFNLSACPSGWSVLAAAQGRYLVGLPAGGTLGGTDGTALTNLEDRPVGQHTHVATDAGHTHPITDQAHSHAVTAWNGGGVGGFNYMWASGASNGTSPSGSAINSSFTGITGTNSGKASITVQNAGAVASTNAPYLQLLICVKN